MQASINYIDSSFLGNNIPNCLIKSYSYNLTKQKEGESIHMKWTYSINSSYFHIIIIQQNKNLAGLDASQYMVLIT